MRKEEYLLFLRDLKEADKAYYTTGDEIMSNKEYDELRNKVEEYERTHDDSENYCINVGSQVVDKLPKYTHQYPALSLDKTKSIDEYVSKFKEHIGNVTNKTLAVMYKMDGSTLQAYYRNGKLENLVTRGNGTIGSVINHNAPYIKGLPSTIDYKGDLVVRGEAVMSYDEFNRINDKLPPTQSYKNPRNLANATISLLDSNEMKEREIWFFAFNLVYFDETDFSSFTEGFDYLSDLGFRIVPLWKTNVDTLRGTIETVTSKVKDFNFPVDGLVSCMDDLTYTRTLKGTEHNPHIMAGFAFKWADETKETTLRKIEWSASRTGLLNPVAVFDPVELEGTTVSRASLHNVSYILDRNLMVGDKITVYKANMIIPQVDKNLSYSKHPLLEKIDDVYCPCCGKKASYSNLSNQSAVSMVCTNPFCAAKRVGEITHAVSREGLNVIGLSEEKVRFLIDNRYIESLYGLLSLTNKDPQDIISMDNSRVLLKEQGWGISSINNLLEALQESKKTTFVNFLTAMGIPNIGKGQSKALNKFLNANKAALCEEFIIEDTNCNNIELLTLITNAGFDFRRIDGFGNIVASSIHDWVENNLIDPVNLHLSEDDPAMEIINIIDLLEFSQESAAIENINLSNKNFVITGSLEKYKNREELVSIIESLGGKVSGSVSKNTDYLINNDTESLSSKNKKAKELNIPIISEDDFMKML